MMCIIIFLVLFGKPPKGIHDEPLSQCPRQRKRQIRRRKIHKIHEILLKDDPDLLWPSADTQTLCDNGRFLAAKQNPPAYLAEGFTTDALEALDGNEKDTLLLNMGKGELGEFVL